MLEMTDYCRVPPLNVPDLLCASKSSKPIVKYKIEFIYYVPFLLLLIFVVATVVRSKDEGRWLLLHKPRDRFVVLWIVRGHGRRRHGLVGKHFLREIS